MKKILQTIYLRLDSASKSLTKRALAQLILKIIFSLDGQATKDRISKEINGILGTKIKEDNIDLALELLTVEKKITEKKNIYSIEAAKKIKIEKAYNDFLSLQNRIVDGFFNNSETPRNLILQWFEDVTIKFFTEYSSEWVSDLSLTTRNAIKDKHLGIQAILDLMTDENPNINPKDKSWLKSQYWKFILSNQPDVYSILWDYGTSGFSSSLITANTSADAISIEAFTNTTCILDTNVLMYLDLEQSKFKDPFRAMENIFVKLNISPVYFGITRDEFTRTIEHKKNDVIRIVENYSQDVISQIDDPFLQTALYRQCQTREDFERFFDKLLDIPALLSETLELKRREYIELENAIELGQKDENLKERINNVHKRKKHRDKRKNALLHDAGLISGAEFIRKGEKCFILSRDNSINEVALEAPIRNEMPIAIGIDTLINVLAIDNGGTDIDPTNYAPLFASIIKLALIPERDVFKIEDLTRMLDVQTQIADLPTDRVIEIAKELHHNSVIGIPEEEISLQLTRSFQSAKLELQTDLDISRRETLFEKEEKEKYFTRSGKAEQKLREQYTGELRDKYDRKLRWNRVLIFLIFPVVTILITGSVIYFNHKEESLWRDELISLGVHIIAWFIADFFFLNKRIVGKFSERVTKISEEVEKKIKAEIGS